MRKTTARRKTATRIKKSSAFRLQLSEDPSDSSPVKDIEARPPSQTVARGSSGTKLFAGYLSEEYLQELTGTRRADTYDKMRRSDGQVKMVTGAIVNLLKGANWEIDPGADGDEYKADRDLIEEILFRQLDDPWETFVGEAATNVYHGYSLFEVSHKVVTNHPKFGSFNAVDALGFRSQRTIERWNVDAVTGKLVSVTQMAYGDAQKTVDIPAEFLLHFPIEKEGSNFEGISPLRPCFGAYTRKDLYLKLMAIGMEGSAVPFPVVEIPEGKQDTQEYERLIEVLESYGSRETNYLVLPQGWKWQEIKSAFDPQKCIVCVEFEDKQMSRAFLANFLELGQTGGGGSYSLGLDLSDFFVSSIEFLANGIASGINRRLIPSLIRMNRGPRDHYPKLKHSGIRDNFGKEFADVLKALAEGRWLTPDEGDEKHLRKRIGLPAGEIETRRSLPTNAATAATQSAPGIPAQGSVQDTALNGAQVTALIEIVAKVAAGQIPRDSAKSMIVSAFQVSVDQAERMLGSVGKGFVPKVPPEGGDRRDRLLSEIRLSEKPKSVSLIEASKEELSKLMREKLKALADRHVVDVMRAVRAATETERPGARRGVTAKGRPEYQGEIAEALAGIATKALEGARREVPKARSIRLHDELPQSMKLSELEKLPKRVQKKIQASAERIATSQVRDIEERVAFAYDNAEGSTDSNELLEKDLKAAADAVVEAGGIQTAAGDVVSLVVNEARNSFFFEPEVVKEIASFTFVNVDPQSPICQDLAGSVFFVDDPEAWRYFPPLHHNCKSVWVPNPKGKDEPEVTGLKPSKASLERFITLAEPIAKGYDPQYT